MEQPVPAMSAPEYLAWERSQVDRHEYLRGEVYSMAGGSLRHNALGAAIVRDLGAAVRGSECRVLSSDQRIVTVPGEHYVYADATLVCGPLQLAEGTSDVLANPRVIFEVLSRSTEAYDRGEKWAAYRAIPSLSAYVLVSQAVVRVELFRRRARGWSYEVVEAGGHVEVAEVAERGEGPTLAVDALYEGVLDLPGD